MRSIHIERLLRRRTSVGRSDKPIGATLFRRKIDCAANSWGTERSKRVPTFPRHPVGDSNGKEALLPLTVGALGSMFARRASPFRPEALCCARHIPPRLDTRSINRPSISVISQFLRSPFPSASRSPGQPFGPSPWPVAIRQSTMFRMAQYPTLAMANCPTPFGKAVARIDWVRQEGGRLAKLIRQPFWAPQRGGGNWVAGGKRKLDFPTHKGSFEYAPECLGKLSEGGNFNGEALRRRPKGFPAIELCSSGRIWPFRLRPLAHHYPAGALCQNYYVGGELVLLPELLAHETVLLMQRRLTVKGFGTLDSHSLQSTFAAPEELRPSKQRVSRILGVGRFAATVRLY
uniref:Uncharacterized protein n=1 Tax=Trichuris muris TaxID=70415 RepID=A0A5S6QY56_TRIMR